MSSQSETLATTLQSLKRTAHDALVLATRGNVHKYILSHRNVVSSNELFRRYTPFWGYNFESKISYHQILRKNESLGKINTKESTSGWGSCVGCWFYDLSRLVSTRSSHQRRGTVLPMKDPIPSPGFARQRARKNEILFWDKFIAKCFTNRYKMEQSSTLEWITAGWWRKVCLWEGGKTKKTRKLLLAHHYCTADGLDLLSSVAVGDEGRLFGLLRALEVLQHFRLVGVGAC